MALDWKIFTQRPYIASLPLEEQVRLFNIANQKSIKLREQRFVDFANSNSTSQGAAGDGITGPTFTNIYSVLYDGVDDRTETSVNYSEFDGEAKGTFSFWFKCNGNFSNQHDTVVKVGPPYSRRTFEIELIMSSQVKFMFTIAQGGSTRNVSTDIGNFRQDDSWHHILFCIDLSLSPNENKTKLFVDGSEVILNGALSHSSFPSHPAALTVGGTSQANTSFQGNLDEVALWSGVDLRDDIATIYNSGIPNDLNNNGLTPPTTYYRMGDNNGGTGTTITDNGTTDYDLSFVSEPVFETDVPS